MIDYHTQLKSALNSVLPTHYEMTLTSKTKTPCISSRKIGQWRLPAGPGPPSQTCP